MPELIVGRENTGAIRLHYEDHGEGSPIVLIHGWPLNGHSWEKQVPMLLKAGYRVITYDRRGFGASSQPSTGYDYDTLAADLDTLMTTLDLRDATLVGFSMGGGEVARYLGTYGSQRVTKAVFLSSIPPFLLKTPDNPLGMDGAIFDGIRLAIAADRPAFLARFLADFYNVDILGGELVSAHAIRASWNVATAASAKGTLDCVAAWLTDFRKDLTRVNVPVLIVHGNADRILPIESTGVPLSQTLKESRFVVVEDGPHGILWTHARIVNDALMDFLNSGAQPVEHPDR